MASAPERQPLSQSAIVSAGIALADAHGVDALTMRKLAEQLGFKVMALYNHVANKQELLTLMVDAVAREIHIPSGDVDPLDAIRLIAVSARSVLTGHAWAPDLWLRHLPGPARTNYMETLLRSFDQSGLSTELAHHGFHAVTNHVLGYAIQAVGISAMASATPDDPMAIGYDFLANTPVETYPYTVAHVQLHLDGEAESSFELVLDMILDGLVRLNTS